MQLFTTNVIDHWQGLVSLIIFVSTMEQLRMHCHLVWAHWNNCQIQGRKQVELTMWLGVWYQRRNRFELSSSCKYCRAHSAYRPWCSHYIINWRERIEAQHVLDQKIGPRHTQFTQIIALGWTLIGKAYFGKTHDHETVVANKTHGLSNVREQIPKPCINEFVIKEKLNCCSNTLTCKELITWKTSVKHTATI